MEKGRGGELERRAGREGGREELERRAGKEGWNLKGCWTQELF